MNVEEWASDQLFQVADKRSTTYTFCTAIIYFTATLDFLTEYYNMRITGLTVDFFSNICL